MYGTTTLRSFEQFSTSNNRAYRYWSPASQAYASGDQLLRFLREGWALEDRVEVETHWFGEARHIQLYHVTLYKADERLPMCVMGNPFTDRVMKNPDLDLTLVHYEGAGDNLKFKVIGR